jgi:hypothetical protein
MGQVHPLLQTSTSDAAPVKEAEAIVHFIESVRCGLCGAPLGTRALRYQVVSPQSCDRVTVCHVCRKAALGAGYRPAG